MLHRIREEVMPEMLEVFEGAVEAEINHFLAD